LEDTASMSNKVRKQASTKRKREYTMEEESKKRIAIRM
jgi:hypothetical protein